MSKGKIFTENLVGVVRINMPMLSRHLRSQRSLSEDYCLELANQIDHGALTFKPKSPPKNLDREERLCASIYEAEYGASAGEAHLGNVFSGSRSDRAYSDTQRRLRIDHNLNLGISTIKRRASGGREKGYESVKPQEHEAIIRARSENARK